MTSGKAKPTHEELLERAKLCGQHIGAEMNAKSFMEAKANLVFHFLLTGMRCPMCLQDMTKAKSQERKVAE